MYIIIAGCGRVGSLLAMQLHKDNHDVVVIDNNPDAFKRLGEDYGGGLIEGDCLDKEVLLEAGIEKAEVLIAATNNDNTNIMLAQIAKEYNVGKVIARIDEFTLSDIYKKEVNINTVCATKLVVDKIKQDLKI